MTTEIAAERLPVLPLENAILLHEGRAEIKIQNPTAEMIKGWVEQGHNEILASGLKSDKTSGKLTEDDLYKTGVLIKIVSTHTDGDGI